MVVTKIMLNSYKEGAVTDSGTYDELIDKSFEFKAMVMAAVVCVWGHALTGCPRI
ncbi:MAG: hypothetical protein L6Q53_08140 [Candidatus Brocadia sinica]|nr:hypothetical protein [Candidatus Brocadia sinica]